MVPREIAQDLERLAHESRSLEAMPNSYDLGVIRFEYGLVKRKFASKTAECREYAHKKIIDTFLSVGEKVYNELSSLKDSISSAPRSVDDFVSLIDKYNVANGDSGRLKGAITSFSILIICTNKYMNQILGRALFLFGEYKSYNR